MFWHRLWTSGIVVSTIGAGVSGGIGASVVAAGGASASVAPAITSSCGAANIYVNSGGSSSVLDEYSPAGVLLNSAPLATSYGDIAFSADGTTLYGVSFGGAPATLVTLNRTTGAVESSVTLSGAASSIAGMNGLTGLPDGTLLAGSYATNLLYDINPTTGATTVYGAALPNGSSSGGDFLSLSDGDTLALVSDPSNAGVSTLMRIHPNNTITIVGTVPTSFGAAQSDGVIYLAGADGVVRSVSSIPTAVSNAAIPTTTVVSTGLSLFGAASAQDAGECDLPIASPTTTSATPTSGGVVTIYPLDNVTAANPETPLVPSTLELLPPGGGPASSTVTVSGQGTYQVGSNASVTFSPTNGFTGSTTPIGFQVSDTLGNVTSSTISLVIAAAASTPVASTPVASPSHGGSIDVTPDDHGYWTPTTAGAVTAKGDAGSFGSMTGKSLNASMVGIAATPTGDGYWTVGADGGVFSFGDASFYGSLPARHLNKPVVSIARSADGKGYWLAGADGGVFAFGDAGFYGSHATTHLNAPVVGLTSTPDGDGYWLVAADGGVFAYGDAGFYGSMANKALNQPIVGMATTPDGKGYWLAGADGGVFAFGDAHFYGSDGANPPAAHVVGISATADGGGYSLVTSTDQAINFGDANL